jgi:hypothetical protein
MKTPSRKPPIKAASLPHSWTFADWPDGVFPNSGRKGKYLVRANRDELLRFGALTRIGRDIVILGEGYARFLSRNIERVEGYVPAAFIPIKTEAEGTRAAAP